MHEKERGEKQPGKRAAKEKGMITTYIKNTNKNAMRQFQMTVDEMLEIIFRRSCVNGHYKQIEKEKQDFYVKYIKKLRLVIEDRDGQNYYKIEVGK